MLTLDQAKRLTFGTVLYHARNRNADGSPQRWRVNGAPKLWKRSPGRVQVPIRHGLRSYGHLTEDSLHLVCLSEEEALA